MEFATIRDALLRAADPDGDADEALVWHDYFAEHDVPELAASALDRAHGLRPDDRSIAERRQQVLDRLAIEEFGIRFRYIPAGTFLMGSPNGDLDEQPVHEVLLNGFWVSDTPVTWAKYCALMDWTAPPEGFPQIEQSEIDAASEQERHNYFLLHEANKIRTSYCDNLSRDERSAQRVGPEDRKYDRRPMVAVSWQDAYQLGERMTVLARESGSPRKFNLPREDQWEKAWRGGLIQNEYAWGNEPPAHDICDFDHADDWEVGVPTDFPPNGYGLHGMAGGVWEWVLDYYDALAYHHLPANDDTLSYPPERVLRGGSWLDCADAMRVAFRMSRVSNLNGRMDQHHTPGIGFRLCMS